MSNLSIIVVSFISLTVSVIYNFIALLFFAERSRLIIKLLMVGAILN